MTTARKMRWIGWGMTLVGWVFVLLGRYEIGLIARGSQALRTLPFVLIFVGLTLSLIGLIKETKAKRLAEQHEAVQLEQAK